MKPSWGCIRPCTIVLSEKLKLQVRVLDRNVRYEKVQIYKYIVYGSPKEAEVVSLAASQQQGDLEPDEEESWTSWRRAKSLLAGNLPCLPMHPTKRENMGGGI